MLFKIYSLIPKNLRSKIILILFLVIMSIVFELFSLALIIPLMSSIFGIETSLTNSQYPLLNDLNNLFGLNNINILLVILFLSGIILKNIVLMASYKNLYSMKFLIEKELSSKLLSNYISSPYSFFMKRNTSNLLHNVTQEIWKFCDVVAGCFYLIAEIIILLGIVSILLIVNTKVTLLIVIILGIFGYFFLKFYKKNLKH